MQDLSYTVLSILFSEKGSLMDGWMDACERSHLYLLLALFPFGDFSSQSVCVGSVLE